MSSGEVIFDYRDEDHPRESWDQFLVRKMGEQSTPQSTEIPEHLGGHLDKTHMDRGTFMYLKDKYDIESFIDIGCGTGGMVNYALGRGCRSIGIDGDYSVDKEGPVMIYDFTKGPVDVPMSFDLGWSVEFVEHIEEEYMDNWMAIFQKCKYAVITYAPPGWPGHHHVNCQDQDYWVEKFNKYGLTFDEEETSNVRENSNMRKPFMQSRGLFFKNNAIKV